MPSPSDPETSHLINPIYGSVNDMLMTARCSAVFSSPLGPRSAGVPPIFGPTVPIALLGGVVVSMVRWMGWNEDCHRCVFFPLFSLVISFLRSFFDFIFIYFFFSVLVYCACPLCCSCLRFFLSFFLAKVYYKFEAFLWRRGGSFLFLLFLFILFCLWSGLIGFITYFIQL